MRKFALICDIDNCYTDSRKWMEEVPHSADREAWDEFQKKIDLATPNTGFIQALCAISNCTENSTLDTVFITGREDRGTQRVDTINQIEAFSNGMIKIGVNSELYMRGECDYRPSDIVKEEILESLKDKYSFTLAIDDELCNCEMFVRHGITTTLYDIETGKQTCINPSYREEEPYED